MVRVSTNPTEADRARRDELRLRELDRSNRRAFDALGDTNTVARHTWQGSGNIAPNYNAILTSDGHWSTARDDGVARFQPVNGFDEPGFYLNRPGRWALLLIVYSDCTNAGTMRAALTQTGGILDGLSELRDSRYRGAGYAQAGRLDQTLTWTGPVFAADLALPLVVRLRHDSGGAEMAPSSWWLQASFLGEMTVPETGVIAPVANVPQDDPENSASG